jgi:Domain of unknown function DUF488
MPSMEHAASTRPVPACPLVVTANRIYSVGYEGMTARALVDSLVGARVATLVDVRLTPASRKPGFSRKALTAALDVAGIDYVHEPDLGNPPDNRDSFRTGDGNEGRRRMRERLFNDSSSEHAQRGSPCCASSVIVGVVIVRS